MKDFIIIALTLTALYKTFKYKANWEYHALLWIAILCALGYRAFPSSNAHFQIHPIDLVLLLSLLKIVGGNIKIPLPVPLKFLLIFCFIGVILKVSFFEDNLNSSLNEAKSFMLIYPCFLLSGHFIKRNHELLTFNYYFGISMLVVSLLAALEYYFPTITVYFGKIYQVVKDKEEWELSGAQFFDRARFTNWGAPTAGHVILLAVPLIWSLKNTSFFRNIISYYFVSSGLVLAIYIAGARADWILLVVFFILNITLYSKITRSMNRFILGLIGGIIGIIVLLKSVSQVVVTRFLTGLVALQGEADYVKDSSGFIRKMRLDNAWETVLNNPFGIGWGNSGWVHADVVQLTANLGWIPGLLFIFLYLSIMVRGLKVLNKMSQKDSERKILAGLWITNIAVGFQFSINGIYNLTQTSVPFFLMMGLLHYYTLKVKEKKVKVKAEVEVEEKVEAEVEKLQLGVER